MPSKYARLVSIWSLLFYSALYFEPSGSAHNLQAPVATITGGNITVAYSHCMK